METDKLFYEIQELCINSLLSVQKVSCLTKHYDDPADVLLLLRQFAARTCSLLYQFSNTQVMINDKHCFEMYGYDILIDDNLKPWLIEVNASPSLTADTPQDYELKFGLLDDVYSVIDVEGKLEGALEECVGGYDLIYNGMPMRSDKLSCYTTRLGCFDDRVKQLKKLYKAHAKRSSVH